MKLFFLDHGFRLFPLPALCCVFFIAFSLPAQAQYRFDISHMNGVTHIEIPEIAQADYQISKKGSSVEIQMASLDAKSADYLSRYADQFIKKITVARNASLSRDVVSIQLNDSKLEMFDYLTDAPSSLSVDFYVDDGPVAGAEDGDDDEDFNPKMKGVSLGAKDKASKARSIASSEFIKGIEGVSLLSELDAIKKETEGPQFKKKKKQGDDIRVITVEEPKKSLDPDTVNFKMNTIIENRGKIFIKFPTLLNEDEYLAQLLGQKIEYEIEAGQDAETKDFMKIKRLFGKGDYRNFLKAKKIFNKKYPISRFSEMSYYMEAESLFAMYKAEGSETLFTQALKMYDALLAKYPKSNLAERTMLLVSYLRMKKGRYMEAVRNLKSYSERYKTSPLLPNIELIMAQGLLRLQDYEESLKVYQKLLSSDSPDAREKAAFDLGDVFFEKMDYPKAISYYNQAIATYPNAVKKYPNVSFNLGEAQFLSEKYKESLTSYKKFIDLFPQHEYAAYAWTRMGEVLEAAEVEPNLWRGYYHESVFRFQNKNGGIVAKINLLSHQAKKNDGVKFDMVLDEMKTVAKGLTLPHAAEFLTVKIADTYFDKGRYKKATSELISFFKNETIPSYEDKFLKRIGRGISFQIREALDKGDVQGAFALFDSYDSLWQRKSKRHDFDYLRGVGFEQAGLYKKAIPSFQKFLENFRKLPDPEDTLAFEQLPPLDEIYLHLVNSQVRAGLFKDAEAQMAYSKPENLSPARKDQWHFLSSKISESKNDLAGALAQAQKMKSLNSESAQWLADLYVKNGQAAKAVATLDAYIDSTKLDTGDRFLALKSKLAVLENADKAKYYDFLQKFYDEFKNKKFDFDREKYQLGAHFAKQNKAKEADEVWSGIAAGSVWKKMAKESRDEKSWDDQYKKYINRIPAMEQGQEKAQ